MMTLLYVKTHLWTRGCVPSRRLVRPAADDDFVIWLLGSAKSKINEDQNDKNVAPLQITEVVLARCNIVNNDYQQEFKSLVNICSK